MVFGKTAVAYRWQVPLFRSLRDGDVEQVEELITNEPQVLHRTFTDEMEEWELQLESVNWYEAVMLARQTWLVNFRFTACLGWSSRKLRHCTLLRVMHSLIRCSG
jgi:hypothetical protein